VPEFYYQIKGRLPEDQLGMGPFNSNWEWPPLFSDKVEAPNKKAAKLLIEEEYGRQFPLRVLANDLKNHAFLLSISEILPEDDVMRRRFAFLDCKECAARFRIIDKFNNPAERDTGPDFCSQSCAEEGRLRRIKDYDLVCSGKLPAVIYLIRQLSTGKCYVGQTIRPITLRWWQHLTYPSESKFHQVIKSTPLTDWQFQALETIALPDDHPNKAAYINDRERHWILHFDCIANGYNTVLPSGAASAEPELEFDVPEPAAF